MKRGIYYTHQNKTHEKHAQNATKNETKTPQNMGSQGFHVFWKASITVQGAKSQEGHLLNEVSLLEEIVF